MTDGATVYKVALSSDINHWIAGALRRMGVIAIGVGVFLAAYVNWRIDNAFFTASDGFFLLGAVLLLCGGGFRLNPFRGATTYWLVAFTLMLFGLFIGSVVNGDPICWLIAALQYSFSFVLLPHLLVANDRSDGHLIFFSKILIAGMVCMELFGILVYYGYDGSYEDYQRISKNFITGGHRLGAFLGQANWNAAVISLVLPFVLYLGAKKRISILTACVCSGVLGFGLVLSASFTGFVSAVAVLVVYFLVGGTKYAFRIIIGMGIAAAILFYSGFQLPEVFRARVGDAIETGDLNQAGTYTDRMDLIREAWRMVDHTMIVGLGVDQYRVVSAIEAPVHNMYLLLWAEGGLLALIGWLMLMTIAMLSAVQAFRYDRQTAALGLSVLTSFLIFSTASPHMYARVWLVPLVLALAFGKALGSRDSYQSEYL